MCIYINMSSQPQVRPLPPPAAGMLPPGGVLPPAAVLPTPGLLPAAAVLPPAGVLPPRGLLPPTGVLCRDPPAVNTRHFQLVCPAAKRSRAACAAEKFI